MTDMTNINKAGDEVVSNSTVKHTGKIRVMLIPSDPYG